MLSFADGFAINGNKAEYYYWQLCVMLRKLLVAGLITLTKPFGVVVQAQLAMLVFAIALYFQVKHEPFRNPVVNVLETTGIIAFLFTAWLGVLMSLPNVPVGWKEVRMTEHDAIIAL